MLIFGALQILTFYLSLKTVHFLDAAKPHLRPYNRICYVDELLMTNEFLVSVFECGSYPISGGFAKRFTSVVV
jgi:hypothetical protein